MKLSEYLAAHDMSMRAFSLKAGVARTTVMRLLAHGFVPQHATARKLAAATDGAVSEQELIAEACAARAERNSREAA